MKILLINGAKDFNSAKGELNKTLQSTAKQTLLDLNHEIKETIIDSDYNVEEEVEKFLWMDAVIWQMPAWWMSEPWIVKKYIDIVFSAGAGKLFENDGRHRTSPDKGYGTGGLLKGKKYMLSLTWNAPFEAFNEPNDFFEGVGVDVVYMHFNKANEFLGMTKIEPFMCNDVVKNPKVEQFVKDYKKHLTNNFS